jgi:hypothetical protein
MMTKEDVLREFPAKRIEPADGMAVTAEVWKEAHDYHHLQQRLHALLSHGSGILTGLEVVASDPPDSSVYILPGIAVDTLGQTIVLREPLAYDIGRARGLVYLQLTYGESRPRTDKDRQEGVLYVHAQFGIEAGSDLGQVPGVELARIQRQSRESPVADAQRPLHPGLNEIDLRFRHEIGAPAPQIACVAVCYVGGLEGREHGLGVSHLARALGRSGQCVVVDDSVPLAPGLEAYSLVYLVGRDAFQLSADEMNAIYAYLQGGGTVLIESCRHGMPDGDPPADASFADLLASMGIEIEELQAGHGLLSDPFLFSAPPPGFETEGEPRVSVGGGVLFSASDYGCLWRGLRRDRAASREEIRAAMEWGGNIVAYAGQRRGNAREGGKGE